VVGEVFAVLEVELLLPALLGGTRRDIAVRLGIGRMDAPNCSSTRMPALSLGTPAATAAVKPS